MFRKLIPATLILVSTAAAMLLGELLVRLIVNPGDFLPATRIMDPALGSRIKPHTTGHDALGFRNPEVPERADVVAIGDSMTYGYGATANDSWPRQLGILLGKPVYNMALGSYGPLQYLHLAEHDAKQLRPQLLLVGFYFGNDFLDAYSSAYEKPYWHSWREAETGHGRAPAQEQTDAVEPKKMFADLRDWLFKHSVLYSMVRVVILPRVSLWEQDRLAAQAAPDRLMTWTDPSKPSVRTIFVPQARLSVLDPQLTSVQEGLRMTKRSFEAIKEIADSRGTRLLVILIPTKERAYCRYLRDSGVRIPNALGRLCDAEAQIKEDLVQFFAEKKIAHIDVTRAMEEQIQKHVQLFPADSDGHPQAKGYSVIAQAVYDALRSQQREK